MTPEETALFQQAQATYNAGHHQEAYEQFREIYQRGNIEDVNLLCWIGYSTPSQNEAQRALADVERLKPNHPSLPKLRDRVKKLQPQAAHEQPPRPQPVNHPSMAVPGSGGADNGHASEKPPDEPVTELHEAPEGQTAMEPPFRQWRKQGDEKWQYIVIPLRSEGNHELFFVPGRLPNKLKCASCGKSLSETWYLFDRTVPKTAPYKQYCMEHSPIPIETQAAPGLFQRIATLEQHIAALEQRVAELEAQKGGDTDSPGKSIK